MFRKSSIPVKDVDFNVAQRKIIFATAAHAANWGVDANWLDNEVLPAQNGWLDAWAAYEDPEARTPTITFTKIEKRKALEKLLRKLVKNLQSSVTITPEELRDMGIVVPSSSRTPAPVATTYPDYEIDTSTLRRLILQFYDQGQKKSRAKPPGQHGAEILWVVSEVPVVDMTELTHSMFDTHTPFILDFQGHERGKTVYFCLRWENTRGEKGPWSEIKSAIIP
jgi:hypothetical protein